MTSKEAIYDAWAPSSSPWSPWAKPVLFSGPSVFSPDFNPPPPLAIEWAPPADGTTALVLNFPGREGVKAALLLAARGYRPVPLYNAVPSSSATSTLAAVDVLGIVHELQTGAEPLARCALRDDAPPAFLLDSNRRGDGFAPAPGRFDNRSVSFTTDFPSGNFLQSRGIRRVLLVQSSAVLDADLSHTLRRWQEAGLAIERFVPGTSVHIERVDVPKPGWFGFVFQRVLIALGLRRNLGGGFGGWVPEPSSGAG